jgi:hypothetical protein
MQTTERTAVMRVNPTGVAEASKCTPHPATALAQQGGVAVTYTRYTPDTALPPTTPPPPPRQHGQIFLPAPSNHTSPFLSGLMFRDGMERHLVSSWRRPNCRSKVIDLSLSALIS